MDTFPTHTHIRSTLELSAVQLRAQIIDERRDTLELFTAVPEAMHQSLVEDVWRVGLRAVANARAEAEHARLHDVGRSLLGQMQEQMGRQLDEQRRSLQHALGRFFDPNDGEVTRRLEAFASDEGVLAKFLVAHVGPHGSVMAQTLARHVGEQSELLRKLSPTDREGVVSLLEERMTVLLQRHQAALADALDPSVDNGAIAKFLRGLRQKLDDAETDRSNRLAHVIAALDANDDGSLVARLMRQTKEAQQAVLQAINPDSSESLLGALDRRVRERLEEHAKVQREQLDMHGRRQAELEQLVRETMGKLERQRAVDASGPRGGHRFEDAVIRFIEQLTEGTSYLVRPTGGTPGKARRKVGDAIIEHGNESIFAGSRVVVEAKRDASYNKVKALDECELAMSNRDAPVALFVMADDVARESFDQLGRYGNTVLVRWSEERPESDAYLRAGVLLTLALATRRRAGIDDADRDALRDVERRVVGEIKRLSKMRKAAGNIRNNVDTLEDELRKADRALELLLRDAKKTLQSLDVALDDAQAERESPITLSPTMLGASPASEGELGATKDLSPQPTQGAPSTTSGAHLSRSGTTAR